MRRRRFCFPCKTLIVGAVMGVSAAYFPAARGQAIVTYGVSVGRAAGAGAAAGTGAAGIFDKLNNTTANAARHEAKGKPGVKASPEMGTKASSPNAIMIGGSKSADAAEDTSTLRTASGISIAGLTNSKPVNGGGGSTTAEAEVTHDPASAAQPANPLAGPDGFRLPEIPLLDPAPAVSAAQTPVEEPAGQPKTSQHDEIEAPAPTPAQPLPAAAKTPAPVVAQGIASKAARAPASSLTPLTITAGTPIQDVIELLGQPLMRLSGVAGADYDERYVFLTSSGSKLTILTKDGLVLKVIAG